MRGLWFLGGHRKVKRKEGYKKHPTCFAAFQKTSSLYEFCQVKEDSFSPVKQLLPFWRNCNNKKTWNVLNCLALFCSGTCVRVWVIVPDWGRCSCFDFGVKMKWCRLLLNLYHAQDFFSLSVLQFSAYGVQLIPSFISAELVTVLCCFKFLNGITVLSNIWNQEVVFVFFIWSILGHSSFSFTNSENTCYSLVSALRAGQRLFNPCLNTWEM